MAALIICWTLIEILLLVNMVARPNNEGQYGTERTFVKKGYHLESVVEIPDDVRRKLAALSVSTLEEFLAQYAVDREGFRNYLEISPEQLTGLVEMARKHLDAGIEEILTYRPTARPMGAKLPSPSDEFHRYVDRRQSER